MTRDERDLDALLRQSTERLDPAPDAWATISRRASRRKWAKATLSVAAGVIVVAGAVPAVIAVRDNNNSSGGNQQIAIGPATATPHHSASIRPVPIHTFSPAHTASPFPSHSTTPPSISSLAGFFPDSLSFVTQSDGYLWGTIGTSRQGVLAQTKNGGQTWTRLPSPPNVTVTSYRGGPGDGQVRFGYTNDGFIFGSKYFFTNNAGATWQQVQSPGYIDDLETTHGYVWALVRPSPTAHTVRLYSATTSDPTLRLVKGVPPMTSIAGADSIAVNYEPTTNVVSADVIVGSSSFYTSPNGRKWQREQNPCQQAYGGDGVQNALLSTLDVGDVVAVCGYNISGGAEDKRVYTTTTSGQQWTAVKGTPAAGGYLDTMSAGTGSDIIIGSTRCCSQVSRNGGSSWTTDNATGNISLSFVGFISPSRIVALADREENTVGAFAASNDAGKSWTVIPFSP